VGSLPPNAQGPTELEVAPDSRCETKADHGDQTKRGHNGSETGQSPPGAAGEEQDWDKQEQLWLAER